MTGKYVVIDGIDGGGKTTLFESLHKVFHSHQDTNNDDVKFIYTREPGGTLLGEDLRKMLLSEVMNPYTEMCLFMGQRKEVREMLKDYLERGVHVISDRSESATFAYQIRGRCLDNLEELFWKMNSYLCPFPTMYIFLDLLPKIAFERLNGRGENVKRDVFEKEQIEYFERVRNAFLEFPKNVAVPCFFVDANQAREKVAADVIKHINDHLCS